MQSNTKRAAVGTKMGELVCSTRLEGKQTWDFLSNQTDKPDVLQGIRDRKRVEAEAFLQANEYSALETLKPKRMRRPTRNSYPPCRSPIPASGVARSINS